MSHLRKAIFLQRLLKQEWLKLQELGAIRINMLANESIAAFRNGEQAHTFTYIDDIVQVNWRPPLRGLECSSIGTGVDSMDTINAFRLLVQAKQNQWLRHSDIDTILSSIVHRMFMNIRSLTMVRTPSPMGEPL
jgi:hypothetical protein